MLLPFWRPGLPDGAGGEEHFPRAARLDRHGQRNPLAHAVRRPDEDELVGPDEARARLPEELTRAAVEERAGGQRVQPAPGDDVAFVAIGVAARVAIDRRADGRSDHAELLGRDGARA